MMANGKPDSDESKYLDGVEEYKKGQRLVEAPDDTLSLKPSQHERLKGLIHGNRTFAKITSAKKRYLMVGDSDGENQKRAKEILDSRRHAITFRFENFSPPTDERYLWTPVFDLISRTATQIVGVVEDYNDAGIWGMGPLYHRQSHVHDSLWMLKKVYEDDEVQRQKYDNGNMALLLGALEEAVEDRVVRWRTEEDLEEAVEEIP
jgi:hypothetical protein